MPLPTWLRPLARRLTTCTGPIRRAVGRLRVDRLEDRTVPSGIQGVVFDDINASGARDAGEPGRAGVTVFIDANRNGTPDAGEPYAVTLGDGSYSLAGLADGTYPVALVAPAGSTQTGAGSVNGPGSGVFGEVRDDFRSPEQSALPNGFTNFAGIAWANGKLYVTQVGAIDVAGDTRMYRVDPDTGAVLAGPITIPDDVGDIAFDGTNFWGADFRNNWVIKFDPDGNELLPRFQTGLGVNSLEWADGSLWVLDRVQQAFYKVDPTTGAVLQPPITIALPSTNVGGLTYDGSHFWVNDRNADRVCEIDPATGAVGRSFAAPGGFAYGLGFDGQFLWTADNQLVAGGWQGRILQYDISAPAPPRDVTISGAGVAGVDLGLAALGSVSGTAYSDIDSDGVRDAGEPGVGEWRVYLDSNGNGQFDPWERNALTGPSGSYDFASMRPGTHTVAQDLAGELYELPHWSQTAPASGKHVVTFPQAGPAVGRDFGNHLDRVDPARPTGRKPAAAGSTSTPGWPGSTRAGRPVRATPGASPTPTRRTAPETGSTTGGCPPSPRPRRRPSTSRRANRTS